MDTSRTPELAELAGPHWEAASRGQLSLPTCTACGHVWYPPALFCPTCLSDQIEWQAVDGQGQIDGWCTFYKAYFPDFRLDTPYTVILVTLDVGAMLYSNLVGDREPQVGMRVQPEFVAVDDHRALVHFRPLQASP